MYKRALLASIASVCLLTNCTPYQEINPDEQPGSIASPVPMATPAPEPDPDFQASPAEGGAAQVDTAVAALYKIRTRADIAPAVDAMMALADRDNDGQISEEEFGLIAPALALADNTVPTAANGTTAERQGAGEMVEETGAARIGADEFFTETAGSDGMISRADLTAAITARFNAADTDGNGELTAEEARTFAASMRFARP